MILIHHLLDWVLASMYKGSNSKVLWQNNSQSQSGEYQCGAEGEDRGEYGGRKAMDGGEQPNQTNARKPQAGGVSRRRSGGRIGSHAWESAATVWGLFINR